MASDEVIKGLNGIHSNKCQGIITEKNLHCCKQENWAHMTFLFSVISWSTSVYVPAGFVVWVGDDNELRVGNDGRPLLLPYVLERQRKHMKSACTHMKIHYGKNTTNCLQIYIKRHTETLAHNMYVKSSGAE